MNNKIIKSISSLSVENIVRMLFGLVTTVVLARYLGTADFGKYNYIISFVLIFMPFFTFGMDDIIVKEMIDTPANVTAIISRSNYIRIVSSCLGLFFLIFCFYLIGKDVSNNIVPLLVFSFAYLFKSFETYKLVFTSHTNETALVSGRIVIFLTITLFKVVIAFLLKKWMLVVYASAVEVPVLMFFNYIRYRTYYEESNILSINTNLTKKLFLLSLPLFFLQFLTLASGRVDQLMIANILNYSSLSYYAISAKLIELWIFIPNIIILSLYPQMIMMKGEEQKDFIQKMYGVVIWFGLLLSLGVFFVKGYLIKYLYGDTYIQAQEIITLYSLSFVFQIFNVARFKYVILKKAEIVAITFSLVSLLLNILFNYFFILEYGVVGAIYGTILSYIITSIIFTATSEVYRESHFDFLCGLIKAPRFILDYLNRSR